MAALAGSTVLAQGKGRLIHWIYYGMCCYLGTMTTFISTDGSLQFQFSGTLGAWQPDIDFNRVKLVIPEQVSHKHPVLNSHKRRSIFHNKNNDYDNFSSRITKLQPSLQFLSNAAVSEKKKAVQMHQPREDPRNFYRSDVYLKEVNEKKLNNEVSEIYPGEEVVRADKNYHRYGRPSFARLSQRDVSDISSDKICVKCPHDRTLIMKSGSDRVILQYPQLKSCSGLKAPRDVKFVSMYGPRFGSLLGEGYYGVVGHLSYRNEVLQYCYMNVRVLTKTCPLPKHLTAECGDENKVCNFTCRDPKAMLYGHTSLKCGEDNKWVGNLPFCKVKRWCASPPPPEHGRISCKGATVNGWGLTEGSTCRVKCARSWRPSPRSLAVCRRGAWTYDITCIPSI